jgi:hypothetical protein
VDFTLFPSLPLEIQDQIWATAANNQADTLIPRIHPTASDRETRALPSLDSNLRYRPKPFYLEIQLGLAPRSHPLPVLFSTCRESRDAIKKLYSVWEKKDRDGVGGVGYVYVDKRRDVLYFAGWGLDHWVLLKALNSSITPYHKDDEIARQQFMVQLRGCRNVAFDFSTCPIHSFSTRQILDWMETFRDMRKMIVVFDLGSGKTSSGEEEFVILDEETLKVRGRRMAGRFQNMTGRLKEVEKEMGVRVPEVEAVFLVGKGEARVAWAKDLLVHSS